jgi:hypothetical protein
MRSFFKKPSWASTSDDSAAPEFYRRSTQTYNDIVAASRQQHESSTASKTSDLQTDFGKSLKRRRISESPTVEGPAPVFATLHVDTRQGSDHNLRSKYEIGHDIDNCVEHEDTQKRISPEQAAQEDEQGSAYMRSSIPDKVYPPQTRALNPNFSKQMTSSGAQTYSGVTCSPRRDNATNSQSPQGDLQAQLGVSRRAQAIPEPPQSHHQSTDNGNTQCSDTSKNDEVVQILITSAIENTKPLVVQRLASQRLRDVRLAWCTRQGFGEKMTSSVFLTWNRKRLFDVTTCRSLLRGTNMPPRDYWAVDDQNAAESNTQRLHMEAVTGELLKSQKRVEDSEDFDAQKPDACETVIKITLKCPGSQDISINVRNSTKVSHVISTYRDKKKMSLDKTVRLMFDGEHLNPESTIEEYEIADLDLVEVLVK